MEIKTGRLFLPMGPNDCNFPSDGEPIARFGTSRDGADFAVLWQRHQPRIYRQCLAFSGNRAMAEDLTAETFLLAWQKVHRFQDGDFVAWLVVIARNCCINQAKSAWSRLAQPAGEEISAMADQPGGRGSSGEDWTFSTELEQIVNQLPDEQRIAIKLYFIDGYSYEQIAGLMQCDVKRVKSYLQNARRKLQQLWFGPSAPKEKGPGA